MADPRYDTPLTYKDVVVGSGLGAFRKSELNLDLVDVRSFPGVVGDGVNDDTAGILLAIAQSPNKVLHFGYGYTFLVTSQLLISSSMSLKIDGTIRAGSTGVAGTPLILITTDNVNITGYGIIDGNSTLWCGIQAESSTAVIANVRVEKLKFTNIAVDSTLGFAVDFGSVQYGRITDNYFINCGVVNNVSGGGFAIYTQFCQDTFIANNTLKKCGSSGINSSANLNTLIEGNSLFKTTLFAIKAGYGITANVSSDVAPTTSSFTIAKTSSTTKQWFVGTAFVIILSNTTKTVGVVKAITDNGTYYAITCTTLSSLPVTGKSIEIFDTNNRIFDNYIAYTGDNALDLNVMWNTTIRGNHLKFGGAYQDVGVFAGLHAGIWVGADAQGAVNILESFNILIEDNVIEQNYGSAIQIFSTNDIMIDGNICKEFNIINNAAYGGIEVGRLGYYRSTNVSIKNNMLDSTLGYGIYAGFYTNGKISGNLIKSASGLVINASVATLVDGNLVEATANSASAVTIQDASGTNATNSITLTGNNLRCDGTTTVGINVTDTNAAVVKIQPNNDITATTPIVSLSTNNLLRDTFVTLPNNPIVAAASQIAEGYYDNAIAAAATVAIGSFIADNGTAGKMVIEGTAWQGTNAEGFRMVIQGGMNATTVKTLTLDGASKGVSWLAAGDFTLAVGGDSMTTTVSFKNNAAATVRIQCKVVSYSRY